MILRDDDINYNTDFYRLYYQYQTILEIFPTCELWASLTIFSKQNTIGTVYPEVPFKDKPTKWFYNIDRVLDRFHILPRVKICSHGLFHCDHAKLPKNVQEMSILGSCNFLATKVFVPPFNRFNDDTIDICQENGIELIGKDGWLNFEYERFDPTHEKWYFHSWRWDIDPLRKLLTSADETPAPRKRSRLNKNKPLRYLPLEQEFEQTEGEHFGH